MTDKDSLLILTPLEMDSQDDLWIPGTPSPQLNMLGHHNVATALVVMEVTAIFLLGLPAFIRSVVQVPFLEPVL